MSEGASPAPTLTIKRFIVASPETIFELWTDPVLMASWMSPYPGEVHSVIEADVRPGGAYRLVMGTREATCEIEGTYVEVQPPTRLVFTWRGTVTGHAQTLVTLVLKTVPGGTELMLTHERLPNDDSRAGHVVGWGHLLDHLRRAIAGRGRV